MFFCEIDLFSCISQKFREISRNFCETQEYINQIHEKNTNHSLHYFPTFSPLYIHIYIHTAAVAEAAAVRLSLQTMPWHLAVALDQSAALENSMASWFGNKKRQFNAISRQFPFRHFARKPENIHFIILLLSTYTIL